MIQENPNLIVAQWTKVKRDPADTSTAPRSFALSMELRVTESTHPAHKVGSRFDFGKLQNASQEGYSTMVLPKAQNMNRAEVEDILSELGYVATGEVHKGFTIYYNEKYNRNIWLGDAYLSEDSNSTLAFEYLFDVSANEEKLRTLLTTEQATLKGIVKEDIVHTILEGYSINGVPVHKDSEEQAKANVGNEVGYKLNYDGYRKFGAFKKDFYKTAQIL